MLQFFNPVTCHILSFSALDKKVIRQSPRSAKQFVFSPFNQNLCCGCSKELFQWDSSFSTPKKMLIWMHKKYSNKYTSDFIWPFLQLYMRVIPNSKMAFIFPISCILALIFPILIKYFSKCEGKGSFLKSQIKSLYNQDFCWSILLTLLMSLRSFLE